METLRLPDYYIDANGLPSILNNKQKLLMNRPSINNTYNTRINNNNKTNCGCSNTTKPNTRRQDANEMDTLIVRSNSHDIKNLILTQDRITDAGLNKKMKCMYNELKKKHMENKPRIQIKDHSNHEDLIS